MKHKKILFILLIFSVLIVSCKTKTKLERKRNTEMTDIYNNIINKYIDYETLLFKITTQFNDGKRNIRLKGTIKINKDSLIVISLTPGLGFEIARIKFTKDSIFILDRLSLQLTKGKYKFLNDTYKIDVKYSDIQSILTNELFIYPKNSNKSINEEFVRSFNIRTDKENLDLYRKTENLVETLVSINDENYLIKNYIINDINNRRNLNIKFEDVYSEEFSNLPKRIYVVSSVDNKFTKIRLNYSKITKNKNLNFSFRIPAKYKTIVY